MNKKRLQEIKDSIDFQREVLIANNMGTLCVDEEQELYDEVIRLTNNWNELEEWVKEMSMGTCEYNSYDEVRDKMKEIKEGNNGN